MLFVIIFLAAPYLPVSQSLVVLNSTTIATKPYQAYQTIWNHTKFHNFTQIYIQRWGRWRGWWMVMAAYRCTIFLCYLGFDLHRNPYINKRDHLVGQLTLVMAFFGEMSSATNALISHMAKPRVQVGTGLPKVQYENISITAIVMHMSCLGYYLQQDCRSDVTTYRGLFIKTSSPFTTS